MKLCNLDYGIPGPRRADAKILRLIFQPRFQLVQRLAPMRDGILLRLWHLCVCPAFVLEARIPAEILRTSTRHGFALCMASGSRVDSTRSQDMRLPAQPKTYMSAPLKHNHLLPWTLAVSKGADGLRRLIIESCEELVEVSGSEGFEKPFAVCWSQ